MRSFYKNGFVGAGVGLALVALSYLGEQLLRLPFLPFDIFDWLARVLPGDLVTFGIDSIVNLIIALNIGASTSGTAKQIEQLLALLLFIFFWTLAGWLVGVVSQRSQFSAPQAGLSLALLVGGAIVIALNLPGVPDPFVLAWQLVLMLVGGWALGWILAGAPGEAATAAQRRHFLIQFGGAILGFGLVSWGISALFGREPVETGADKVVESGAGGIETADVATDPADLQDRLRPAPGTRRELTSNDDFYRIDINTRPPLIEQTNWELQVDGLFANPRNLSLIDLMAFPAVTQPITLSCISNRIGGDLISTAEWTGVRLGLLLAELGLKPEAQALYIEAEDGFYESVSMTDMMDPRTLLVYAMNGQTLPQAHGFPLRIYIP
ncbi:MAG: molybdopterin-dependent oxidoreductase, partial [Anaerolineales bacterium]|nr:molybdopterin-dependent oxidoreductase [Anaerolineales bacterium]